MSIVFSIIAFLFIILIHEWGHFIAGRICKVHIHEFSIGFGPAIFRKKGKKETTFSIRIFPLGGYCLFSNPNAEDPLDSSFKNLPIFKRIFISAMGPLMNIILAILVLFFANLLIKQPTYTTIVESVKDYAQTSVTIEPDDKIISINGLDTNGSYQTMLNIVNSTFNPKNNKYISIIVERNGKKIPVIVTPTYIESQNSYNLGIVTKLIYKRSTFLEAARFSKDYTIEVSKSTFEILSGLFSNEYSISDMSGIVGMVDFISAYAKPSTAYTFFLLVGMISINAAIMNLLPIPGLDGSKILFCIIEKIIKKPISEKFETVITLISFALIIILFIFITINDILLIIH